MKEAGVLLGVDNKPIYWHTPNSRSGGALPDSHDLWSVIWENRAQVTGFAHTHPGSGTPGPSYTDKTTFEAIEAALGKHLNWYILSLDGQSLCLFDDGRLIIIDMNRPELDSQINKEWMKKLRELSEY